MKSDQKAAIYKRGDDLSISKLKAHPRSSLERGLSQTELGDLIDVISTSYRNTKKASNRVAAGRS